jgi:DNA-binding transcriptional LysR family regulator
VSETTRWQCPRGVTLLPVVDLDFPVPFYLIWRKDDSSALLQRFVAQVEAMLRPSSETGTNR